MARMLDSREMGFDAALSALVGDRVEPEGVAGVVADILSDIRERGDAALLEATRRLDGLDLTAEGIPFAAGEVDAACERVPAAERDALELAAARIRAFHERQRPSDDAWIDEAGATLGWRWTPIRAVGLYVPGGTASYPSSVLMNAIPARVAGVERLAICTPTPGGEANPAVLLAARIAGVREIHRVGGAQAIGALAYGTATIAPVDKITGPGNAYVAEAKRQVFGRVGIDTPAGPSEVLVIADGEQDPDWIAVDLLSQAEHDARAQAILVTPDPTLGQAVAAAVELRLADLARADLAAAAWRDHGAVVVVRDLDEAAAVADRVAAEHLQILTAEPEALAARISNAGSVFLGPWTPEAVGDYAAGPNHVLPTAGAARFASGLGVLDFMKRTTHVRMTPDALRAVGPAAEVLARSEGLGAHALSLRLRLDRLDRAAE